MLIVVVIPLFCSYASNGSIEHQQQQQQQQLQSNGYKLRKFTLNQLHTVADTLYLNRSHVCIYNYLGMAVPAGGTHNAPVGRHL